MPVPWSVWVADGTHSSPTDRQLVAPPPRVARVPRSLRPGWPGPTQRFMRAARSLRAQHVQGAGPEQLAETGPGWSSEIMGYPR